jgi:hypothetical protein
VVQNQQANIQFFMEKGMKIVNYDNKSKPDSEGHLEEIELR